MGTRLGSGAGTAGTGLRVARTWLEGKGREKAAVCARMRRSGSLHPGARSTGSDTYSGSASPTTTAMPAAAPAPRQRHGAIPIPRGAKGRADPSVPGPPCCGTWGHPRLCGGRGAVGPGAAGPLSWLSAGQWPLALQLWK